MENIQHDYFIWEEKNLTDQNQNLMKNEESVKESSIIETKNDLTQKDWRDITDPKLRRKAYIKAYQKTYSKAYIEANKDKIKIVKKNYYKINKQTLNDKHRAYNKVNKDKLYVYLKTYREKHKDKIKTYRETNKDKINSQRRVYYKANKDKVNLKQRICRKTNKEKTKAYNKSYKEANKDKIKAYRKVNKEKIKDWFQSNKDKINSYCKNKKKTDIQYKLSCNLRNRLCCAINNNQKAGSAVKDLGCSIDELKSYLESKFSTGMTWDNWTTDGWHIDHIKPLASFDLTDRQQFIEACHYTNLQPLWATDNLIKSDKIL